MAVLDRTGTERAFRNALLTLAYVKADVVKLVDADRASADVLAGIDDLTHNLRLDLESYQDCYREP